MEQIFPWLLTLCLAVFLYILIAPIVRHVHQERHERLFTEEMLQKAEELYGFSDKDFVIMSEIKCFRLSQGEQDERRNTPGG